MTDNRKPSINNGDITNDENIKEQIGGDKEHMDPCKEYIGPLMVDSAPSILKKEEASPQQPRQEHTQTSLPNRNAQTPPSNRQAQTPPPNRHTQTPPPNRHTQTPPPNRRSQQSYGQSQPGYSQSQPGYGQAQTGAPYYSYRQNKNGTKKGLLIFGIILAVLIFLGFTVNSFFSNLFTTTPSYTIPKSSYIARIAVEGEITSTTDDSYLASGNTYNHQFTLESIDDVTKDSNNVGIFLYVDTPGGGVYESDEIYRKIKNYQETTGRPVYVFMGSMAASGGYYISAPADKIFADRNTWTGSIGVTMGTFYDISKLLKKYGIKAENITSGRNKAMGSMVEPMTKEQRKIFQSLIDDAYNQFVGIIAQGRSMDVDTVKRIGDGRIYTANQAVKNGLVDQIATEEEALALMKSENGLGNCELVKFKYSGDSWLDSIVSANIMPVINKLKSIGQGDLETALELKDKNEGSPLKYLYEQ